MTDGINDGNELREPATENKQPKRRWARVERRELIAFADHHRYVGSHRRANRSVFIDLATPS